VRSDDILDQHEPGRTKVVISVIDGPPTIMESARGWCARLFFFPFSFPWRRRAGVVVTLLATIPKAGKNILSPTNISLWKARRGAHRLIPGREGFAPSWDGRFTGSLAIYARSCCRSKPESLKL